MEIPTLDLSPASALKEQTGRKRKREKINSPLKRARKGTPKGRQWSNMKTKIFKNAENDFSPIRKCKKSFSFALSPKKKDSDVEDKENGSHESIRSSSNRTSKPTLQHQNSLQKLNQTGREIAKRSFRKTRSTIMLASPSRTPSLTALSPRKTAAAASVIVKCKSKQLKSAMINLTSPSRGSLVLKQSTDDSTTTGAIKHEDTPRPAKMLRSTSLFFKSTTVEQDNNNDFPLPSPRKKKNTLSLREGKKRVIADVRNIFSKKDNNTTEIIAEQSIFGCDLANIVAAQQEVVAQDDSIKIAEIPQCMPYFLHYLVKSLATTDYLATTGLFRISASHSLVEECCTNLTNNRFAAESVLTKYDDPHLFACLLKKFLRELPIPLLTFDLFDEWMRGATAIENNEENKIGLFKAAIAKLPPSNFQVLRYTIALLHKASTFSDVSKMTVDNLSTVMGPNMLWNAASYDPAQIDAINNIANFLITNFEELFDKLDFVDIVASNQTTKEQLEAREEDLTANDNTKQTNLAANCYELFDETSSAIAETISSEACENEHVLL